jgi:hypothetical protein
MNQVTMVTRKDARRLLRLHAALTDMLAGMDGLLTRRRAKRKPAVKRKRAAAAPPEKAAVTGSPLARAKAKAAKLATTDDE